MTVPTSHLNQPPAELSPMSASRRATIRSTLSPDASRSGVAVKAPEVTKAAIEQLPVVLSLKEKGDPNAKPKEKKLSEDDKKVAKALDLSEEDMEKYGDEDFEA